MVGISLGFSVWFIRLKGYLIALAVGPLILLFYSLILLNADPVFTVPENNCNIIPANQTQTVLNSNITFTEFGSDLECTTTNVPYPIGATAMSTINYTMSLGILSALFLIGKRILEKAQKRIEE